MIDILKSKQDYKEMLRAKLRSNCIKCTLKYSTIINNVLRFAL